MKNPKDYKKNSKYFDYNQVFLAGVIHANGFAVMYDPDEKEYTIKFVLKSKTRYQKVQYLAVEVYGSQARYYRKKLKPWVEVFVIGYLFHKKNKTWYIHSLSITPTDVDVQSSWVGKRIKKQKREEKRKEALPIPPEFMIDEKEIKKY